MEIINLSEQHSLINQYMAELRDKDYQQNRLLFRNNVKRIGQCLAYEVSKRLSYTLTDVTTPLGVSATETLESRVVLATILRAGLPFHEGFLAMFDHAENAFVSAFRTYTDEAHHEVGIHVEYMATPSIEGKTLILADPMLATGGSMALGYQALASKGMPSHIHVCSVIATPEGIEAVKQAFPDAITTIWCAALDPGMNENKYIVPGFGDAGDLCFGEKL